MSLKWFNEKVDIHENESLLECMAEQVIMMTTDIVNDISLLYIVSNTSLM